MYYDGVFIHIVDPLSQVDSIVGKHIYKHVFSPSTGFLKDKTRILVTHHTHFTKDADLIILMNEGKMRVLQNFEELLKMNANIVDQIKQPVESNKQIRKSMEKITSERNHTTKISNDEDDIESFDFSLIMKYMVATGKPLFFIVIVILLVSQGLRQFSYYWLSVWTEDSKSQAWYYISIFAIISILKALTEFAAYFLLRKKFTTTSQFYHKKMFSRVLHARIEFFESTPIGSIVERFSSDLPELEKSLPWQLREFFMLSTEFVCKTVVMLFFSPYSIVVVIVICK